MEFFLGSLRETPASQKALLAQQMLGGARAAILREKVPVALMEWALRQMGRRAPEYVEAGLRYFMVLALIYCVYRRS